AACSQAGPPFAADTSQRAVGAAGNVCAVELCAAVGEKIASLFPGVTDAFLSVGSQMMKVAGRFMSNGPKAAVEEIKTELKKEQQTIQTKKAGQEQHREHK